LSKGNPGIIQPPKRLVLHLKLRAMRALIDLKPVVRTPRPQRLLDRFRLIGVPPIESPFGIEQRLEPGIGAFAAEKADNLVIAGGQLARSKAQRKALSEVEIGLVRYGEVKRPDVSRSSGTSSSSGFISDVQKISPVSSETYALFSPGGPAPTNSKANERSSSLTDIIADP
jgi:hypothetical protein